MELPITENNQNLPMPSVSMEDVPLSNDEPDTANATGSIEKIPSKSNSLKRFFKMNLSKRSSSHNADNTVENMDATADDADTEDMNDEVPVKSENLSNQVEKRSSTGLRRSRSRRFSFRSHHNTNADAGNDEPSGSSTVQSPSKHSLRVSLSTYFNSVFKRKQNSPVKNSITTRNQNELGENEDDELSKELKRELEQKVTDDDDDDNIDIESQTAEIIDELETMTVTEQSPKGTAYI